MVLGAAVQGHVKAHAPAAHAKPPAATVSYTHDVASIMDKNCVSCHRAGQVAPFALTSYEDVSKRAALIVAVAQSHYMPPWKAEAGLGHFANERRLTDAQIHLLQQWADQGAPKGRGAPPPAPQFASGWQNGEPDLVLQPKAAYTLAADGNDVYQCFVIPTAFPEDRYLSAVEVHPGNRKVVHHVIAYLDTSGKARQLAAGDPADSYVSFGGPGFTPSGALGGWAPGYDALKLPSDDGILLPKQADIVLQVHYHRDGKPETDLTNIGLYFSKTQVDKRVHIFPLINTFLSIPPGDKDYEAQASATLPEDVSVLSIMPHMHLLGSDMAVTATLPGGQVQPMIKVAGWDFNWQTNYEYAEPVRLPKGTRLDMTAHYDNSADNPRNPNTPPKQVTWGEQTTDEMCIAFLAYTVDSEHLAQGSQDSTGPEFLEALRASIARELFKASDKDGDGKLSRDELTAMIVYLQSLRKDQNVVGGIGGDPQKRAQQAMQVFDKDGDGALNESEFDTLSGFLRGNKRAAAAENL
jgi:mono/diheme cytochrome c family protein